MRAIFTYHAIDDTPSPVSIAPEVFERHLDELTAANLRIVPLADLWELPPAECAVALTFDDALGSFGRIAWPLLASREIPVTLFVPTEHVGGANEWNPTPSRIATYDLLDWNEIGHLAAAGVEIGSHGRHHRDLRTLSEGELQDELEGSAERIEHELGIRPDAFAYPYGGVDRKALAATARVYSLACSTELRVLSVADKPFALPRLDAYYFQAPGSVSAYGTKRFVSRLAVRRMGRRARALITGATRASRLG